MGTMQAAQRRHLFEPSASALGQELNKEQEPLPGATPDVCRPPGSFRFSIQYPPLRHPSEPKSGSLGTPLTRWANTNVALTGSGPRYPPLASAAKGGNLTVATSRPSIPGNPLPNTRRDGGRAAGALPVPIRAVAPGESCRRWSWADRRTRGGGCVYRDRGVRG